MYRRAQIWTHHLLCLVFVSFTLTIRQDSLIPALASQQCAANCICLSSKQVLCNTGGLEDIPTRQLSPTVEDLTLSKNNFVVIKSDAFAGLRSLRKLTLDRNNISNIMRFAFRGLNKLQELSIQETPLSYIGEYSFAALQNLSFLLLANNKISYIEGYSFAGTVNVKVILLSNNPLHTVRSHAFSGLINVGRLILPSGIRVIEPDAFNGLQEVGLLKLTFMDLTSLSTHTFRGLTNITALNIQESDLGVIHKGAFSGLRYVDTLNIVNNKIDAIERLYLTKDAAVNVLRLHGNHILRAPRRGDVMFAVRTLNAIGNHFPCDCQIHFILESDFANGSVNEFRRNNHCISPIEYNGKPMNTVDADLVARCHDRLVKDNLGSKATPVLLARSSIFVVFLPSSLFAIQILLA